MGLLDLVIALKGDSSGFRSEVHQSTQAAEGMGAKLRNIGRSLAGVFAAAGLSSAAKSLIDYGGKLTDLSKKTTISTDALQEFEHAAKLSGASLEDVANAFRGLAKARDAALTGDKEKLAAFNLFGIDTATLRAGNLEQIFRRIAATIETTDFGADELPLVESVLGKMGAILIPMMKDGLAQATEEAKRLGMVLSGEVVKTLDDAGDAMDTLIARLRGPAGEAVSRIAKMLSGVLDALNATFGTAGAAIGGFRGKEGSMREKFDSATEAAINHLREVIVEPINLKMQAEAKPEREKKAGPASIDPALKEREKALAQIRKLAIDSGILTRAGALPDERSLRLAMQKPDVRTDVDQLQRVGLNIGGRRDPLVDLQVKQVAWLEKIHGVLSKDTKNGRGDMRAFFNSYF